MLRDSRIVVAIEQYMNVTEHTLHDGPSPRDWALSTKLARSTARMDILISSMFILLCHLRPAE